MTNHAKNLRRTRADMLGTDDEEHYGHCVAAAHFIEIMILESAFAEEIIRTQLTRIDELEEGACRFNCRTKKEAFMAGFDAGALECVDSGLFICDDLKKEVTEAAYKEWVSEKDN